MTSIIKVDTIQTSAGGTPTAASLGIGGTIGQVVTNSDNTNTVVSGSTYIDTGLSATITPTSSSSKILINISQDFQLESADQATNNVTGGFKLLRDATTLYTGSDDGNSFGVRIVNTVGSGTNIMNNVWNYTYIDEPSSVSAIVYKTQVRTYNTTVRWRLNNQVNGTSKSFITLMEVLA
jgi:hypothetical protein